MPVAKKTYYLNADRSKAVAEGDPDAAFLLVREGSEIDPAQAEQYKVALAADAAYDAVADHEAKHGGETDAQAADARQRMLAGQPDPDGPAVEGERGVEEKATAQPENTKAVSKAPQNKAK